jgi:hypothetical protein
VDASKRMAHEAVRARFAALQQGPDPTQATASAPGAKPTASTPP